MPDFKWLINITGQVDGKLKSAAKEAEQSFTSMSREISRLTKEAEKAEAELQQMASGADLEKARGQVQKLGKQLESLIEQSGRADDLLISLANKKESDIAKTTHRVTQLGNAITRLTGQAERMDQVIASSASDTAQSQLEVQHRIEQVTIRLERMQRQADEANTILSGGSTKSKEAVVKLNAALTEQKTKLQQITKFNEEWVTKVAAIDARRAKATDTQKATYKELNQAIQEIISSIKINEQQMDGMSDKFTQDYIARDRAVEGLNTELAKLTKVQQALANEMGTVLPEQEKGFAKLKTAIKDNEKAIPKLTASVGKLEEQLKEVGITSESEMGKAKEDAQRYEGNIKKLTSELQELENEHAQIPVEAQAAYQRSQADAKRYRDEIERLTEEMARSEKRLEQLPGMADRNYARVQGRVKRLKDEQVRLTDAFTKSEKAFDEMNLNSSAGYPAAEAKARRLRGEVTKLNSELEQTEQQGAKVGGLGKQFAKLAIAIGGAVGAGMALNKILSETSRYIRLLNDARFRGGFADTQMLQQSMFAFSRFGLQQEQIKTMIEDSSRSIRESLAEMDKIILDPRVQLNPADMLNKTASQQLRMFLDEYARLADDYNQEVSEGLARSFMLEEGAEFLAGFAANKNLDDVLAKMNEMPTISEKAILALTVMEGAFNNLKLSLIGISAEVLGAAAPAFTAFLDVFIPIVRTMSEWLKEHKDTAKWLGITMVVGLGAATIGFTLLGAGVAFSALQAIGATTAFTALAVSVNAALWPIALVVLALAGMVIGIILVVKNIDRLKAAFQVTWAYIKNITLSLADSLLASIEAPIQKIHDLISLLPLFGARINKVMGLEKELTDIQQKRAWIAEHITADPTAPLRQVQAQRRQQLIDDANADRLNALSSGPPSGTTNSDNRTQTFTNVFNINTTVAGTTVAGQVQEALISQRDN